MEKDIGRILETISGLVPEGVEAYVVGGNVRDMLMGRESVDIDLAVSSHAGELARDMAWSLGGSAFVMDEVRDVHRVVLSSGPAAHVDISPLRGNINDDLAARDFTVNAMAVPVSGGWEGGIPITALIDPFGGLADIGSKTIRVVGKDTFKDDPLRLIRAFRLSAQIGFAIGHDTLELVRPLVGSINTVSPERVRDELYMILDCEGAADAFGNMRAHGLLFELMPELRHMEGMAQGGPHVHDLITHSLLTLYHAEAVMADTPRYFGEYSSMVDAYLEESVDGFARVRTIVKLCALLHDSGKPGTIAKEGGRTRFIGHDEAGAAINGAMAKRLRMSDRARGLLASSAALHMRPLTLSGREVTGRALHRLARDAKEMLPALSVVALSDALATRERFEETTDVEALVRRLTGYYYGEYRAARAEPLLRGGDIMAEFGLSPGPVIGDMLDDVEEMRADGVLRDRRGALDYIRENMGKYRR